jgi:hypothetical protein
VSDFTRKKLCYSRDDSVLYSTATRAHPLRIRKDFQEHKGDAAGPALGPRVFQAYEMVAPGLVISADPRSELRKVTRRRNGSWTSTSRRLREMMATLAASIMSRLTDLMGSCAFA